MVKPNYPTGPLKTSYQPKAGEAALSVVVTFEGGRSNLREEIRDILDYARQYGGVEIAILDAPPRDRTREDVSHL